jgi:hypothetical protein
MRSLRRALKKAKDWCNQTKGAQLRISRRVTKSRRKQARNQSRAKINWRGKTVTGVMKDGRVNIEAWQESEGVVTMRKEMEKLLETMELRQALEAAEKEMEASEIEEKAQAAVDLMEALMAQEASLELEERKAAEARKLRQDMEDAEQKLEQGALEVDTQWSAHTIGDKVTDASSNVAAWKMWKVLEEHEAIRQDVMAGIIHGWWSGKEGHNGEGEV